MMMRVDNEADLLDAIGMARGVAEDSRNWLRPGEDLQGDPPKAGVAPDHPQGLWLDRDDILPYVRIHYHAPQFETAVRLTCAVELTNVPGHARPVAMRVLHIQIDIVAPKPVSEAVVQQQRAMFFDRPSRMSASASLSTRALAPASSRARPSPATTGRGREGPSCDSSARRC